MSFEFFTPQKIIFGSGSILKLGFEIKPLGKRPLILCGSSLKNSDSYEKIISSIKNQEIIPVEYIIDHGEPSPSSIDEITDFAASNDIDCVVSIGGGSVIDTGKAVAGLVVNKKGVENYLEGVGRGYKLTNNPLPFIAIPTTAGSGAEATKNSVISDLNKKYKKSFRDDRLLAKVIIIDPELTLNLPENKTFNGGMDTICQLIESYTTKNKNDFCRALTVYFLPKAINALKKLKNDLENIEMRFIMQQSCLASGIALANSGLGAVHGFASGIGGMFDIPHGLVCAILLPHIIKLNHDRDKNLYSELASYLNTGTNGFIDILLDLNYNLGIPEDFKRYNISRELSQEIAQRSQGGSMTGNPVVLSINEWSSFIEKLL